MGNAFVSYSRRDQEFVRRLVDRLQENGHDAWVDWEEIPLTADWMKEIETGIEEANDFIFVISPDSVQSEICREEIDHALKYNKRLVPILYRELIEDFDKSALHPQISSHNWIFFREKDEFDRAFDALNQALNTDLSYVRAHTRLLTRAIEWHDKGQDDSFLIRGNDLADAQQVIKDGLEQQKSPAITDLQERYVSASVQAEKWRKRERMFTSAIIGAFIIALVMLGAAIWQAIEANEARQTAQRLSLAANAQVALGNNNTDLAVSLALIANDSGDPRGETERALADAAYSPGTRFRFDAHEGEVQAVTFAERGDLAVSADDNGGVFLWNTRTLEIVRTFTGHQGAVNTVDISPNTQWVLTGGDDGTIRLWNTINEQVIVFRLDADSGELVAVDDDTSEDGAENTAIAVRAVKFDQRGSQFLTGHADGTMALWDFDVESDAVSLANTFTEGHEGAVISVDFHPDASLALSFALNASANTSSSAPIIWELETGEQVEQFDAFQSIGQNIGQGAAVFSPDGEHVLSSFGVDLLFWNWRSGELIWTLTGHGSNINSVIFSRDGRFALSSGRLENSVRQWDIEHGIELRRFEGHGDVVESVSVSGNARYALSGSQDGTVRVWDLANGAELINYTGHTDQAYGVDIASNDRLIASASDDDTIHLWDIEDGDRGDVVILEGHEADIWRVMFSPDDSLLITGSEDRTARLWDVESGDSIILEGHTNTVTTVGFNSDGTQAITGANDRSIRIWDTATGEQLLCFGGTGDDAEVCLGDENGQVRSVAFNPDNSRILVGDNNARLIDATTGEELWRSGGDVHAGRVNRAVFNGDGSRFVTGSADGTIALWTTDNVLSDPNASEDQFFAGHSGQVRSVVFTQDNARILSGSADFTMRLWDIESGLEVRRFDSHTNWVSDVAITTDGHFAVSAGWDQRVIVWHIHNINELTNWTLENRFVRELTANEQRTYRTDQVQILPDAGTSDTDE